ncbi:GNAT family N-acetyltransferase [Pseudarthrobacter sulfonivorans]|uniref:GNAT family N-acetyltransferase n=1 Tax=Pseudarthrobacter sulfonivorans TaxID=121292 RepID=UPI002106D962|nr:GNAT family protein [Pseudarthrobacter sulfonivorans]
MHHEIVLTGHGLSLIPLAPEHAHALYDFVDEAMWAGMAAPQPHSADELAALFEAKTADPAGWAFAVTDQRTGAILGTTALNAFDAGQQRVEVGGTFFGRQFWGSHVNPASKHALLAFAFEVLDVHRAAFRCDARNVRSAAAIERLGATFEGVLRSHRTAPDGTRADSAVFSILQPEWPSVQQDLQRRLEPFALEGDGAGDHAAAQAGSRPACSANAVYARRTFAAL